MKRWHLQCWGASGNLGARLLENYFLSKCKLWTMCKLWNVMGSWKVVQLLFELWKCWCQNMQLTAFSGWTEEDSGELWIWVLGVGDKNTRKNIRLTSWAQIENVWVGDWVGFVRGSGLQMKNNNGFYELSHCVIIQNIKGSKCFIWSYIHLLLSVPHLQCQATNCLQMFSELHYKVKTHLFPNFS